mmetsp:Transcript_33218/g.53497  ORF Transcript_33218/g.53497 Transcript_33218/m.53497 type:complete len:209 (+) Transcript_33218:71-697(+)
MRPHLEAANSQSLSVESTACSSACSRDFRPGCLSGDAAGWSPFAGQARKVVQRQLLSFRAVPRTTDRSPPSHPNSATSPASLCSSTWPSRASWLRSSRRCCRREESSCRTKVLRRKGSQASLEALATSSEACGAENKVSDFPSANAEPHGCFHAVGITTSVVVVLLLCFLLLLLPQHAGSGSTRIGFSGRLNFHLVRSKIEDPCCCCW